MTLKVFVALFVSISMFAQADNRIDTQRPDAPALAAYGSHAIGVRTMRWVNPDQLDVLRIDPKANRPSPLPRYDRPLTVEVWYPALKGEQGDIQLRVALRDGETEVVVSGRGMRDVKPANGRFPLVIISHGYPGNRFLLSHLAENLASKGYVVASIDHTDSTYRTLADFSSTLVNRPLDQLFVLNQMALLSNDPASFLYQRVDTQHTAVVGYSMGGYGALITAGAGLTSAAVRSPQGAPRQVLAMHETGTGQHTARFDARIKTVVLFGAWGMNVGMWDAESLLGAKIPMLFVAGSEDDVSGYENGVRAIWQGVRNVDRALLTFEHANHNAGAPMPAPTEAFRFDEKLGFNLSEHYIDAVWDTVRMNNVSQHFLTAWLGKYLKADASMAPYLDLVEQSNDGVWANADGAGPNSQHSHWHGFAKRTAKGLRWEFAEAQD